jgi:hypothetical protein
MARASSKKFDFGKGIYYFTIKKDFNNSITIKRSDKKKALLAYSNYLKTYKEKCEWLGKWDGKQFTESNYEQVAGKKAASA